MFVFWGYSSNLATFFIINYTNLENVIKFLDSKNQVFVKNNLILQFCKSFVSKINGKLKFYGV